VVNSSRMTGSVAAMVTGTSILRKGAYRRVVLNHVSGSRHEAKLRAGGRALSDPCRRAIPREQALHIAERHLGSSFRESGDSKSLVEGIGLKLEPHLDVTGFWRLREVLSPHLTLSPKGEGKERKFSLQSINFPRPGLACRSFSAGREEGKKIPSPLGGEDGVRENRLKARIGIIRDCAFNFYYARILRH